MDPNANGSLERCSSITVCLDEPSWILGMPGFACNPTRWIYTRCELIKELQTFSNQQLHFSTDVQSDDSLSFVLLHQQRTTDTVISVVDYDVRCRYYCKLFGFWSPSHARCCRSSRLAMAISDRGIKRFFPVVTMKY